ncbi:tetratricopeptide repeat protein [Lysobacter cavernae]|uniref:Tetratricopeptide repeat protein n=1 Tax=Lysobacter cavernae TaxID=1685901 RepID=A0ABV7RQF0_9GAMM
MSFSALIDSLAALHLLRPHWLWALLALPVLVGWSRAQRRRASVWRETVDAHLLPHLLDTQADARTRWAGGLGLLGYVLAVLALAGPSWRQIEQPLWQSRTPLVIALDLSSAALAADLPPSRLAQARAKIATLLRERADGQVGLVAYAGEAFTVAPLTDDAGNVALYLDALSPDVMPVDGQRIDRAIAWSARLLRQAGFDRGDILLLSDHADAAAREAAGHAASEGYRVSVLGLGSAAGAAYRRGDGSFVTARLDPSSLRGLARAGGGRYAALGVGDDDLRALGVMEASTQGAAQVQGEEGRTWQDEGYWLLPPLMLLALLAFRRRGITAALLLCAVLPMAPVQAADWWRRADQTAHARLQQGTQAYRQGDYARAAQLYQGSDNADGHYNRGNALAKAGQYPQAIAAYDQALKRQPGMADAAANKQAVEAAMKRQPPSGGQGQPKPQSSAGGKGSGQGGGQSNASSGQGQPPSSPQATPPQPPQSQPPSDARPADAQAQQAADAAQRERMQRALQQGQPAAPGKNNASPAAETPAQRERRLANEAWLKRVPDDPGGLLREKFRIEHERRQLQGPWDQ